jgi:hypothetical protein
MRQSVSVQYIHQYQLGNVVAQLFETLRYRPECRGFDSEWCHLNLSSNRPIDLGSTRPLTAMHSWNISWGVKAAGADCWHYQLHVSIVWKMGASNSCNPQGLYRDCFNLRHEEVMAFYYFLQVNYINILLLFILTTHNSSLDYAGYCRIVGRLLVTDLKRALKETVTV